MGILSLKNKSSLSTLAHPSAADLGAMIPIATVAVGTNAPATIDFTSIPSTYEHLQIRGIGRTKRNIAASAGINMRFNSDTSSTYANHYIYGSGSSVAAAALSSYPRIDWIATSADDGNISGMFGPFVIDILDYASTNKATTVRSLHGVDTNGGGYMVMSSGLWTNTAAITSVSLIEGSGNGFAQYTQAALYGIKRAGA